MQVLDFDKTTGNDEVVEAWERLRKPEYTKSALGKLELLAKMPDRGKPEITYGGKPRLPFVVTREYEDGRIYHRGFGDLPKALVFAFTDNIYRHLTNSPCTHKLQGVDGETVLIKSLTDVDHNLPAELIEYAQDEACHKVEYGTYAEQDPPRFSKAQTEVPAHDKVQLPVNWTKMVLAAKTSTPIKTFETVIDEALNHVHDTYLTVLLHLAKEVASSLQVAGE